MTGPERSFIHAALLYEGEEEFLSGVVPFLRSGVAADEAALVVAAGPKLELLGECLGTETEGLAFVDVTDLGRNPARLIPAVELFLEAHAPRRARFIAEPLWPARSAAECREVIRHEALMNVTFAERPLAAVCAYDVASLEQGLIDDVERTHPVLLNREREAPSAALLDFGILPASLLEPLSEPPLRAETVAFASTADLGRLRSLVMLQATSLGPRAAAELEVVVNELATDAVNQAGGGGRLRVWRADGELICQIEHDGAITDPLAGHRAPIEGSPGGRWIANQLCDLVELRTSDERTVIRLHARLPGDGGGRSA
jgi:DcmR-like sensory protein